MCQTWYTINNKLVIMVKGSFVGDELYKIQAQYTVYEWVCVCMSVWVCLFMGAMSYCSSYSVCFSIIIIVCVCVCATAQPNTNTFLIKMLFSRIIILLNWNAFFSHSTFGGNHALVSDDCIWFLWQHCFYFMLKQRHKEKGVKWTEFRKYWEKREQ